MEKVVGYHFRAVRIEPGNCIPPTRVIDYAVPKELWTTPLVWFTTNPSDRYDAYGADPIFRHTIEIDGEHIIWDKEIPSWGAVRKAVVKEVIAMKNPWVVDE